MKIEIAVLLIIGTYLLTTVIFYFRDSSKKKAGFRYDPQEQLWVKVETIPQGEDSELLIMITIADHPNQKGLVLSGDMNTQTYRSVVASFKNIKANGRDY